MIMSNRQPSEQGNRLATEQASYLFKTEAISRLWDFVLARSSNIPLTIQLFDLLPSRQKKETITTHATLIAFLNSVISRVQPAATLSSLTLKESSDRIIIEYLPSESTTLSTRETECLLATILAMGTLYIQQPMMPLLVEFQHPEPENITDYYDIFCGPVRFAESSNRLILSKNQLKAFDVRDNSKSVQVRSEIARQLGATTPSRHTIAAALNTSERTLQRRLEEEGTSYKSLLDDVRRAQTLDMIKTSPELSLSTMARQVGFTDAATLTRAFKRWTGMTIGRWKSNTSSSGGL